MLFGLLLIVGITILNSFSIRYLPGFKFLMNRIASEPLLLWGSTGISTSAQIVFSNCEILFHNELN